MPTSLIQALNAADIPPQAARVIGAALEEMRNDIEKLRNMHNTHVHSGVTAGGANTAVPTTLLTTAGTANTGTQIGTQK